MTDEELPHHIAQWFAVTRKKLNPAFAPVLEARFETDTGKERSRFLGNYGVFALTIMWLWAVSQTFLQPELRIGWLGLAGVVSALMLVALLLRQGSFHTKRWRESVGSSLSLCATGGITALYLSGWSHPILYGIALCSGVVAPSAAMPLRVPWAIATVGATIAIGFAGFHYGPAMAAGEVGNVTISLMTCSVWLLISNLRREREERQAYLIGLKQSLAGRDLSRLNQELDDLSKRDPLTGLANRRAHDSWLHEVWKEGLVSELPVGVIMVDIDRFKDYNDFYGHPAGDLCLAAIARCLRDFLRGTSDCVARFGGEEFVVLLPGVSEADCADVAERLRLAVEALELPHLGVGSRSTVTISAGVASVVPQKSRQPHSLLAAADEALYCAKRSGRNRVVIGQLLSPEVEEEEKLFLDAAIKRARVG